MAEPTRRDVGTDAFPTVESIMIGQLSKLTKGYDDAIALANHCSRSFNDVIYSITPVDFDPAKLSPSVIPPYVLNNTQPRIMAQPTQGGSPAQQYVAVPQPHYYPQPVAPTLPPVTTTVATPVGEQPPPPPPRVRPAASSPAPVAAPQPVQLTPTPVY
eukprot:Colp12_sorted_trinity150504_noHs@24438